MTALFSVWQRKPRLPSIRLEGARVLLHPPRLRDWQDWATVRSRNEADLKPFEPLWPEQCLTRPFFIRRLGRQQADWQANLARYFLIRRKSDGALIGGININYLIFGAARHGSLGYWLDRDCRGQGLMLESLHCVLAYGFRTLGLQRVQAACLPGNEASIRLLKKAGMREEGFARGYVQINGEWRDHVLFAITRGDYSRVA